MRLILYYSDDLLLPCDVSFDIRHTRDASVTMFLIS
jgi:hypothetical protein